MKNPRITKEEIGIIKDAQAGSMSAFNRIFYRYKDFVDKLLYLYIKDMDEAKDLTNIVFLKVYEKLSKFEDYQSFGGWLRILAKNTAIDYLRTIKTIPISADDVDNSLQLESSDENTEEKIINDITYKYLISLKDSLPPSYRETYQLFYVDNLTVAQISSMLNVPVGTIKSQLHRIRKLLKNIKL